MGRQKGQWAIQANSLGNPSAAAQHAFLKGEDSFDWPAEATDHARVWGVTDGSYVVDVEFSRDEHHNLVPVGVAVRRTFPTSRHKKGGDYPFVEGTQPEPLSAGDVRGIPFGRVIRAATLVVANPEPSTERHDELNRILVPRGRPQRGRSEKFYRDVAAAARACSRNGLSPAKEIARRKNVSENLVHQWLHVARRRGLFEGEQH